jgi:hypothetical protein
LLENGEMVFLVFSFPKNESDFELRANVFCPLIHFSWLMISALSGLLLSIARFHPHMNISNIVNQAAVFS